jgi:hypothetical protein
LRDASRTGDQHYGEELIATCQDPETWTISVEGPGATASCGVRTIVSASPAELLSELARQPGHAVHFVPPGFSPDTASLRTASARLAGEGLTAIIGAVGIAGAGPPAGPGRLAAFRYTSLMPGAILLARAALEAMAHRLQESSWDAFYPSGLLFAAERTGDVARTDLVFGRSPGTSPTEDSLLPFRRAGLASPSHDEPLILVYGPIEASVSIYFDALPADLARSVRFLEPGDPMRDLDWIARAGIVVIVRDFVPLMRNKLFDVIESLGIPYVWFTDDDLVAIKVDEGRLRYFSEARLSRFVQGAKAIITTSAPLAELYRQHHPEVVLWPCLHDERHAPQRSATMPGEFRIGAFGGSFRRASLADHVLPALRDPFGDRRCRLFATAGLLERRPPRFVTSVPFEPEFQPFVLKWRRFQIEALVHPYGHSRNIGNKSDASLLASAYLGAVPIVADEPAFRGVSEREGVLKAEPNSNAFRDCLDRVADPAFSELMFGRLARWCQTHFDPDQAREPFGTLAALAAAPDDDTIATRLERGSSSLLAHRQRANPIARLWDRIRRRR